MTERTQSSRGARSLNEGLNSQNPRPREITQVISHFLFLCFFMFRRYPKTHIFTQHQSGLRF